MRTDRKTSEVTGFASPVAWGQANRYRKVRSLAELGKRGFTPKGRLQAIETLSWVFVCR